MGPTGETRLFGVIGHPIGHSLSPRMHNASFGARGEDCLYVALDVHPESLPDAVRGIGALGFRGFNVTMPHKAAVLPLLDEVGAGARLAGAVNTVVVGEDGSTRGLNTDGGGFVEACAEAGVYFRGLRVLVVGAGGAAAAIGVSVLEEGAARLEIANRTREGAEGLRGRLIGAAPGAAEVRVREFGEVGAAAAADADVIVNATYLGMKAGDPLPVPREALTAEKVVCDAVYRSGDETRLIRTAREAGSVVVGGGRMLVYQGAQAQRAWGLKPDVGVMSDALV